VDVTLRTKSIAELLRIIYILAASVIGLIVLTAITLLFAFRPPIVVQKVPGPAQGVVGADYMEPKVGEGFAILATHLITSTNPENVDKNIAQLDSFLGEDLKAEVFKALRAKAKDLADERAQGRYFFLWKGWVFDPALNKHFVTGTVCLDTANGRSCNDWVFEYVFAVNWYQPTITQYAFYQGKDIHDSKWIKEQEKIKK
jgi:hypothetical protein